MTTAQNPRRVCEDDWAGLDIQPFSPGIAVRVESRGPEWMVGIQALELPRPCGDEDFPMNLHTRQSRRQFIERALAAIGTLGLARVFGQIKIRDGSQIDPDAHKKLRAQLKGVSSSQWTPVTRQRDASIFGIPTRRDDPPWLRGVHTPMMSATLSNSLINSDWKSLCGAGATA
jgi:hypothetical protein